MSSNLRSPVPRSASARTVALSLMLAATACTVQDAPAQSAKPAKAPANVETALFAGGCFWSVERFFDKVPGVVETTSGFSGGRVANPSYRQVVSGGTGHAETVRVRFDPAKVSYEKLLDVFWHNTDPTAVNRQFCDAGPQYRTAIFTLGDKQMQLAEASKRAIAQRFEQPIATTISEAGPFYPAEDYHQNYHQENPVRYEAYRIGCGRDRALEKIWGER